MNNGDNYKRVWEMLFAQLPRDIQAKVQAAKDNDTFVPKEVTDFVKKVISLAEAE